MQGYYTIAIKIFEVAIGGGVMMILFKGVMSMLMPTSLKRIIP